MVSFTPIFCMFGRFAYGEVGGYMANIIDRPDSKLQKELRRGNSIETGSGPLHQVMSDEHLERQIDTAKKSLTSKYRADESRVDRDVTLMQAEQLAIDELLHIINGDSACGSSHRARKQHEEAFDKLRSVLVGALNNTDPQQHFLFKNAEYMSTAAKRKEFLRAYPKGSERAVALKRQEVDRIDKPVTKGRGAKEVKSFELSEKAKKDRKAKTTHATLAVDEGKKAAANIMAKVSAGSISHEEGFRLCQSKLAKAASPYCTTFTNADGTMRHGEKARGVHVIEALLKQVNTVNNDYNALLRFGEDASSDLVYAGAEGTAYDMLQWLAQFRGAKVSLSFLVERLVAHVQKIKAAGVSSLVLSWDKPNHVPHFKLPEQIRRSGNQTYKSTFVSDIQMEKIKAAMQKYLRTEEPAPAMSSTSSSSSSSSTFSSSSTSSSSGAIGGSAVSLTSSAGSSSASASLFDPATASEELLDMNAVFTRRDTRLVLIMALTIEMHQRIGMQQGPNLFSDFEMPKMGSRQYQQIPGMPLPLLSSSATSALSTSHLDILVEGFSNKLGEADLSMAYHSAQFLKENPRKSYNVVSADADEFLILLLTAFLRAPYNTATCSFSLLGECWLTYATHHETRRRFSINALFRALATGEGTPFAYRNTEVHALPSSWNAAERIGSFVFVAQWVANDYNHRLVGTNDTALLAWFKNAAAVGPLVHPIFQVDNSVTHRQFVVGFDVDESAALRLLFVLFGDRHFPKSVLPSLHVGFKVQYENMREKVIEKLGDPSKDGHMPTFSGAQRAVARGTVIFRYYTTVLRGATTFETQEFLVGGGFIKIDPSKPADPQNLAIAWGEHEGKELHSPCISFTPSSADTSTREKKRKNAKAAN